jgi:hypothetical protein
MQVAVAQIRVNGVVKQWMRSKSRHNGGETTSKKISVPCRFHQKSLVSGF